jgi:hypothetical protein
MTTLIVFAAAGIAVFAVIFLVALGRAETMHHGEMYDT